MAPKLMGEERDTTKQLLQARYNQGDTIYALAAEFGLSRSLTYTLLQEAGTSFRLRGRVPSAPKPQK